MTKVKIASGSATYHALSADTTWQLAAGKTIEAAGYGLDIGGSATGRAVDIDGTVHASVTGIAIGSSNQSSPAVDVLIGKHGTVIGDDDGIVLYGDGHNIVNAGKIDGVANGIEVHGGQTIVNTGEISGATGINIFSLTSAGTTIRNSGVISADGNGLSIYGSVNSETVTNSGTIHGDVDLRGGDDNFIFKSGKIDGDVLGGLGDDDYTTHKAGLTIVENYGEGYDRVYSSVSFELQANVESLTLTGHKNIDATGNGGNNDLRGNAGNNVLYGWYGDDALGGGEGNDVLTGGVGADQFLFYGNTGKDTITDFEAGTDSIYLTLLKGATDFNDMMKNHVDEKANGDLWITYGHDTIVLKDTAMSDLHTGDFFIGNI